MTSAATGLVDGKKHGMWTYWNSSGVKQEQVGYAADQKHGPWITYKDGVKESEGFFRDGGPDGHWTAWHRNGNRAGEAEFRNGRPLRSFTTWHANGHKSGEGRFPDGRADGDFTFWDQNGRRRMVLRFASGQLVQMQAWDERGRELTDAKQLERQQGVLGEGEPNTLLTLLLLMATGQR